MPVNSEFVREERIKRLRVLIRTGTAHLVTLHDAVPAYLREARASESSRETLLAKHGESSRSRMTPDQVRDWDISIGMKIDEDQNGTYSKIYNWLSEAQKTASRNLSDKQFDAFTALSAPPGLIVSSQDDVATRLDNLFATLAASIQSYLDVFAAQLVEDGEQDDVSLAVRDAAGGWPHLRRTVLPDSVLDGYLKRMRQRRTRAEISDSIGAAKEVVEGTLKALAKKFGVAPPSSKPDLADWWKVLKPHLANAKVDKALGSTDGALLKLVSSQITTIQSLGELRNKVGSGHGMAAHASGLTSAHALLAVDTAHTVTRFLIA